MIDKLPQIVGEGGPEYIKQQNNIRVKLNELIEVVNRLEERMDTFYNNCKDQP